MPCYYRDSLATAGNLTTSGTPNTETEAFFVKAGSARNAVLHHLLLSGKMGAQSTLSALTLRLIKWATASTAGTGASIIPTDPGYQAAKHTSSTGPTAGSTRTERGIILTTGKTNSAQWGILGQPGEDAQVLEAGTAYSYDGSMHSPEASINYELSWGVAE
jgi:hypothetical protein